MPPVETNGLTPIFRDMVRAALAAREVPASEATEFYLVQLLTAFAKPGKPDLLEPPLGLDYLAAQHLPPGPRHEKLRRVGDTALFVTGVFVDSLDRSLVGPKYYVGLGRNAYAMLSAEMPRSPHAEPFDELAARFPEFVAVLAEISATELFGSDRDVVRLYRRWMLTRAPREAARLMRHGVTPWAPRRSRTH